jgi:hypothetical protein
MTIKNTNLGGSDWTDNNTLNYVDLNDTFNAVYNQMKVLPAFYLNTAFYDVYDDFESYGVGSFTTNAKWTVTPGSGLVTIASSTNAGGSGKEIVINSNGANSAEIKAIANTANKHIFVRVCCIGTVSGGLNSSTSTGVFNFKIEGQSYTPCVTFGPYNSGGAGTAWTEILVVALGSNQYDVYAGGKKIFANVTAATPNLYFQSVGSTANGTTSSIITYLDDVRQCKSAM